MNIFRLHDLLSASFRRRRMRLFLEMLKPDAETTVVDLGGYPWIWARTGVSFRVLVVNLHLPEGMEKFRPQFQMERGDATRLRYPDRSFDIVYSNSVIEHLGSWQSQCAFANEARRVGRRVWVQTPARWFPIEPHFLAPFIHYLPKRLQRHLARWCTVWGWMTRPTRQQVLDLLAEIRLLTYREMRQLFPDCEILRERVLGLTKSYVAVRC
jgi:hypothetical protein